MPLPPTSQPAQGLALSYLTSPSESIIRHMEQGGAAEQQTSADLAAKAQIYSPDRYREPPPPPPTFLDRHWKKLLALLLVLAAIGVGVGVPVAMLTGSSRSSTTPSKSAVDGNVAGNAQVTPLVSTNTTNATATTAPTYSFTGVGSDGAACDPSQQACGTTTAPTTVAATTNGIAAGGQIQLSIAAPATAVGYDPQAEGTAWSAGVQQTITYQCVNTGTVELYNVTLALVTPVAYLSTTSTPPGPKLHFPASSAIPSSVTIPVLDVGVTQKMAIIAGWYDSPTAYTSTLTLSYISSTPALADQSALAAAANVVIARLATPAPTTAAPSSSPTPAPTTPAPTAVPDMYTPPALPAYGSTDPQGTITESSAALQVITHAGINNFRRTHYYNDPNNYISPAEIASMISNGSPAQWTFNSTLAQTTAKQQYANTNRLPVGAGQTTVPYLEEFKAQPLIWNNAVLVGGTMNNLFLLDIDTGAVLAYADLGLPFNQVISFQDYDGSACGNQFLIGILGTPVIDSSSDIVYVLTKTYTDQTSMDLLDAVFHLHALQLPSLTEISGWPAVIDGSVTSRGMTFTPGFQQSRGSLLLLNSHVYMAFGSQCDFYDYHGWVMAVDVFSKQVDRAWCSAMASQRGAGIWGSGTGPSSDSSGRLFVVTGNTPNGYFSNGWPNPNDAPMAASTPDWQSLDNSVIQLDSTTLTATSFFTPALSPEMTNTDQDLGGSGVALLEGWSTRYPLMAVVTGKNGTLFLLDANNLGGYRLGTNGGDLVLAEVSLYKDTTPDAGTAIPLLFGSPAASDVDQMVYVAYESDCLFALKYIEAADGTVQLTVAGKSDVKLDNGVGAPVIVSNGQAGTAVAWVAYTASVYAFSAIPDSNGILQQLSPNGFNVEYSMRWAEPTLYNGGVVAGSNQGIIRKYQFR